MQELSQEAYRAILEALPTGVYLVDNQRRIVLWSSGAEELTGYRRQEVIGRSCRDELLIHCDDHCKCVCGDACQLLQTMHDGQPRTAELVLLHKDGRRVPVSVQAVPLRDEHGAIIGAVECFHQRTVFPTADPLLCMPIPSSLVDEPTGLLDRAGTEGRLRYYLQGYADSAVPFGVLSIAFDTLHLVRHKSGRNAVNVVLHATARTLANLLGPNDMVGRWSEERFLAVVTGCSAATLERAAEMMKRLVSLQAVPWWGDRLSVSLSVGGSIVQPGDTTETLVDRAEAALESGLRQLGDPVVTP